MAKKPAAKPAAAENLKAKKDLQKAVKLETKKKVGLPSHNSPSRTTDRPSSKSTETYSV
jgi:hypothetical protein